MKKGKTKKSFKEFFRYKTFSAYRSSQNYTSTLIHRYVVKLFATIFTSTGDDIFEKNGFQLKDQIFSFHLIPFASKSID